MMAVDMMSRRALFGLSVGAAAAAVVPAEAAPLQAETYFKELIVGVDFGTDVHFYRSPPKVNVK